MQFVKSSQFQVLPWTHNDAQCEIVLCHPMQGLDPVTSCDARSQVQNMLIEHVTSDFASFYLTNSFTSRPEHSAQRGSQHGWRACACRVTGCLSGLSSVPRIGAASLTSSSRPRHCLLAVCLISWTMPMDCPQQA